MKIMGVDPGFAKTGLGIIEDLNSSISLIDFDLIETSPSSSLPERLIKIYNQTFNFIERNSPDECAVEELFFSKNAKSAFLVGQARGIIILCISQHNIPIYEYTPIQVKEAICGYGRGEKSQLKYMIEKILKSDSIPIKNIKTPDIIDALSVAVCHTNSRRILKAITKR